jgi:hypothetical protein
MKARQLIGKASYGPDELKVLFKAFDDAWEAIAPGVSRRAGAIEAARLKLADIVLGLAQNGIRSAEEIKTAAIRIFGASPE